MARIPIEEHLNWLSAQLSTQRDNASQLLARLKGAALRLGTSLSMNKKFLNLMDQVAEDREKEMKIIDKIESLERHHHSLRKQNLLQRLAAEAESRRRRKANNEEMPCDAEEPYNPNRLSIVEGILFWLFFTSSNDCSFRFGFLQQFGVFSIFAPKPKADPLTPEIK